MSQALGPRLVSCEIGNEPDLYNSNGIRPGYTSSGYVADFNAYYAAIHPLLPTLPFSGPATASANAAWLNAFGSGAAGKASLLTAHYYEAGPATDPSITTQTLIGSTAHAVNYANTLNTAAQAAGLPYRVAEGNSIYGGGKAGVSNTLAAGLWGARLLWELAARNAQGVSTAAAMGPTRPLRW